MPNHVHVVFSTEFDLPRVIAGIKARSGRDCNRIIGRTGQPFWARDYFDRWIRNRDEEAKIMRYIENNPVKAGLCSNPLAWPWSSIHYR